MERHSTSEAKINHAIALIRVGSAKLQELEQHHATLTLSERAYLAGFCMRNNIQAPGIIFYDYKRQCYYGEILSNGQSFAA